ncbi:site-2 protease family protein [Virgisporangium ochraceum]
MLWALAQPAAMAGLAAAFAVGVGLRAAASRSVARLLRTTCDALSTSRHSSASRLDPLGLVAVCFSGTGWGRPARVPATSRERWAVAAGPVAVLIASQLAFVAYHRAYPRMGLPLRLNLPSDVLRGAVAPTHAAQLILSVAVGLLCFGLLALLPVPPFDGYRLISTPGAAGEWERLAAVGVLVLLVVPVPEYLSGRPPLLMALDTVAGPLVRVWA